MQFAEQLDHPGHAVSTSRGQNQKLARGSHHFHRSCGLNEGDATLSGTAVVPASVAWCYATHECGHSMRGTRTAAGSGLQHFDNDTLRVQVALLQQQAEAKDFALADLRRQVADLLQHRQEANALKRQMTMLDGA